MIKRIKQGWKFIVPGVVLVLGGGFVVTRALTPPSMGLQLLGLALVIAGVFLVWYGMKRVSSSEDKKAAPGGGGGNQIEVLKIYPDHFDFEFLKDVKGLGLPWDFTNEGKPYPVLIQDRTGGWTDFKLPDNSEDERYFPPDEYANAATMPATKKYLEWQPSLFQKIAFAICGVIIVIEAIVLIVLND